MKKNNLHSSIFIDYDDNTLSSIEGQSIIKPNDFYESCAHVEVSQLNEFVQQDFLAHVEERVQYQVTKIEAELVIKSQEVLSREKLRFAAEKIQFFDKARASLTAMFIEEFSISDPIVAGSMVLKSLKLMTDDSVSKVFVSRDNFDLIKEKLGEPIMSVLGAQAPVGVGHNLSNTQIMVEGFKSVVVSDLEHILSQYLDGEDR